MGEFERSDLRNEWEISNMRKCINEVFDPGYVFWLESKMIDFINCERAAGQGEPAPTDAQQTNGADGPTAHA